MAEKMPCRKWIRSVCSITGRADGRADGRALANRRCILLGFGKVWTLDPAWIWSRLGKSVLLVSIFALGKSLGLFWSAWGQISLPGRIWESFRVVWGSSRTSQGAFGSHLGCLDCFGGVRGSILDLRRVVLEVILESEVEGIPKSGFGVDS